MDVCNRRMIRPLDHKIANNQPPLTETRHPPQPYSLKIIFFMEMYVMGHLNQINTFIIKRLQKIKTFAIFV